MTTPTTEPENPLIELAKALARRRAKLDVAAEPEAMSSEAPSQPTKRMQ